MVQQLEPANNSLKDYLCYPAYVRKSHVESYSFCPRQFYLQYIQCIDVPENYAMSVGTRFHQFADKFFDIAPTVDPSKWYGLIPRQFGIFEKDMAGKFIDYEKMLFALEPETFMPACREIDLVSDTLLLAGQLDRIDWVSKDENEVRIVEYKTSAGVNESSLKRQFGIYTLLVEDTLGFKVVDTRLINPRLNLYIDYGLPSLNTAEKWISIIRSAFEDPESIQPKCSGGKYAVCQLCTTTEEAGLYLTEEELLAAENEELRKKSKLEYNAPENKKYARRS